jgi:hypothetical protein
MMTTDRSARYLKLIALFKIAKGVLLLGAGVSLLVVNARTGWFDAIWDWSDDELLLEHSRPVTFLLNWLQAWMADGHLRATGLLALFYSGVLFTEGVGVYLQKRWAEMLMVFATAALIPLEVRHVWHRPSLAGFAILIANCLIVWFLYHILRRKPHPARPRKKEPALV